MENLSIIWFVMVFKDGYFIMGDPAKGIITYTAEELEQVWKSHACLTLVCTNNFILQKDIKGTEKSLAHPSIER